MTAEPAPPSRRATSIDVARHAGVSRSTVSQILNGDDARFPPATRDRVLESAAALDYRPSRAGRALVTGRSDLIVVVVPNATFGPHLQNTVDAIAAASATAGLSVVVRFAGADSESTLASVLDLRPTAVVNFGVFSLEQQRQFTSTGAVVVPEYDETAVDGTDPVSAHIGGVQVDAVLQSGPRRLVYAAISDARLDPFGPPRFNGIAHAAAQRGLPEPEHVRIPLELSGATRVLAGLLEQQPGAPVGLCCYNDDVAIAACAAARALGVDIPGQLSLVGADHTDVGQLVSPRLTTVDIDEPAIMLSRLRALPALLRRPGIDPVEQASAGEDFDALVRLVSGETT
ncbi:LacI family DNA-binding transcriptional regulator [Herbiconiux daphne]|uniref:LacI family transcriptional regulator n=1 Tax=Herbiconiux daphne TaxID=2970914 RepID=A0ABT2H7H6_9MICO|nr:LacI family DNA-binding transcriptional regulator [Herbiconiux daphne]MCS5735890.1 LacI family transcriptional regulator [Herbiconiux daphne]